ncbi:hypothetical protein BDN72DRAFT_881667 [Pluteus cervinus]|uniref:Uncharacterized protein n=1 Tax=Pluteus cervinus TaxID=181527 RepID=A0ACD3AEU8_9AGAR|nr:hypothetical protein BDN72DRAFT_881667 [Pluteus cervinus]
MTIPSHDMRRWEGEPVRCDSALHFGDAGYFQWKSSRRRRLGFVRRIQVNSGRAVVVRWRETGMIDTQRLCVMGYMCNKNCKENGGSGNRYFRSASGGLRFIRIRAAIDSFRMSLGSSRNSLRVYGKVVAIPSRVLRGSEDSKEGRNLLATPAGAINTPGIGDRIEGVK